MFKRAFLGLAAAAILGGCAVALPTDNEVVVRNKAAGDTLATLLNARGLSRSAIVVATVVPVDQLTKSSKLGLAIGEQIASRLAYAGVPVVELKLRSSLYVSREGGEFMLSRELKDLTLEHKASLAVVGTYALSNHDVMVTLKAVDVHTNMVVAAHSYSIPKATVSKMLTP